MAGKGVRRIIFQAPTGAGKTILFCGLVQRFLAKYPTTKVIIAVHRDELLKQTVRALHTVAKIEAGMLIAGYSTPVRDINGFMVPHNSAQVIVCMVETLNNRFKKYQNYLGGVSLLIVDECHLAHFNKIYEYFPKQLIIGFTATPISANKRLPMNMFFDDIVSPVTIQELIDQGHLAKNITITIKDSINRKNLSIKGGDFDENKMAKTYSTPKHINNCVKAYEKYCMGEKSIIFNCNVEHSKEVNNAFVRAGYNSRHMDGMASKEQRAEILQWYKETDDAILNNVALYTTGFDEPTIINSIVNRATMSLTLWLQMPGRASRSIPGAKDTFKIIDLGANLGYHMDWNYPHDWKYYFHHPDKVRPKSGNYPTKLCIECEAMIHLSVKICPYCGANNAKEPEYDKVDIDLEVLTKGIDIEEIIRKNAEYKPYRSLHIIKGRFVAKFMQQYKHRTCSQDIRDMINERFQILVQEWCKDQDKPYDKKHKWMSRKWLMDELDHKFGKIEKTVTA